MKLEFELNLMGIVYLIIAVGLVTAMLYGFVNAGYIATGSMVTGPSSWIGWLLFSAALSGGLIAVGLLVPVVRRLFKAFMPSA